MRISIAANYYIYSEYMCVKDFDWYSTHCKNGSIYKMRRHVRSPYFEILDNGTYSIALEILNEYFILLKDYRNKKIDKILNV
jgi:hypothetical protein